MACGVSAQQLRHRPETPLNTLGIIGGTGITALAGLEISERLTPETPWGAPSGAIVSGRFNGVRLCFLPRHGEGASVPPHLINYRANLWALRHAGVSEIVAINAVGGISEGMRPGRLVIPDQLIDYTWGRAHTVDEGKTGALQHIDFTQPYDPVLRLALLDVAAAEAIEHAPEGVYAATQGPRLETAAEVRRLARDGCDVVGMTGMPEAAIARELGLAYASVCMVVNPAPGLTDAPLTLAGMRATLASEAATVLRLISALVVSRYAS